MSTLYLRLPSKAAADDAPHWIGLDCPFALVAQRDAIEREGVAALADLAELIAKARHVVLLLAASDVTLLRLQVPPLSAARLKTALPNLVEDQLMSDPAECVIVAAPASAGLRTVAVMQRGWLELLYKTMQAYGARQVSALPSQLCLPWQSGIVSAVIARQDAELDLTLRLSEHDGIGLPIMPEHAESAVDDVLQALCALVPQASVTLHVPQAVVPAYRDAISARPGLDLRITVFADHWSRWIAAAAGAAPDLIAGLGVSAGPQADWRRWRWPLGLAAGLLLVNIAALNFDWWRMKSEASALRTSMLQTYKAAYPKETVIIDPVAQMKQKIAIAQRASGQLAADDFSVLAAKFGEAWRKLAQGAPESAIAALEYRERSLLVRLKAESGLPVEQMKTLLAAYNLSLSQPSAGVWQIRSAK